MERVDQPSRKRGARRWLGIVAWQIAFVVGGFVLLELGARAYLLVRGTPYDPESTRQEVDDAMTLNGAWLPGIGGNMRLDDGDRAPHAEIHPYLGWEMDEGCSSYAAEYRRLRSGAHAGEVRVLFVGGSVAALFAREGGGLRELDRLLRADARLAGREIHYMNFARGGYKEPQQVNALVLLFALGFEPDVVIDIDGFNEVALGNNNQSLGFHPAFPSASHWSHLAAWGAGDRKVLDMVAAIRGTQRAIDAWGEGVARWRLDLCCVFGKVALKRMRRLRRIVVDQFNAYSRYVAERSHGEARQGPELDGGEVAAVEASVECWQQCSRSMSDLCRARDIGYVQVLQPTLHDAGSKPLTPNEIEVGQAVETWVRGVQRGYPLLRAKGEALRREGVRFIDASMLFKERSDEIYYDCCHYVHDGNVLLARAIAPEVIAQLAARR
jgi:hypothetical protein